MDIVDLQNEILLNLWDCYGTLQGT